MIQKNAAAGRVGNRISHPGEYRVKISKVEAGLSKKQKPMLTVTFETPDEKEIKAWFVKELQFHMKNLVSLKTACGLKETDTAENLLGKECGILVEEQEPTEEGKVFMTICGYGKADEVDDKPHHKMQATHEDRVPF